MPLHPDPMPWHPERITPIARLHAVELPPAMLGDDDYDEADDEDYAAIIHVLGQAVATHHPTPGILRAMTKVVMGNGDPTLEHDHTWIQREGLVRKAGVRGADVWFTVESCTGVYERIGDMSAHCMARKLTRLPDRV